MRTRAKEWQGDCHREDESQREPHSPSKLASSRAEIISWPLVSSRSVRKPGPPMGACVAAGGVRAARETRSVTPAGALVRSTVHKRAAVRGGDGGVGVASRAGVVGGCM